MSGYVHFSRFCPQPYDVCFVRIDVLNVGGAIRGFLS